MYPENHLSMLLDAPLQSWGFSSRFQRRTTAMHPTKSGIVGILAAALGVDKNAADEIDYVSALASLRLTTITLPRVDQAGQRPVGRLEDYHTVENTLKASGKVDPGTVQTYRYFLQEARFGVVVTASSDWCLPGGGTLQRLAEALQDPVWGIWLGRKCCIPSSPVYVGGPYVEFQQAWQALLKAAVLPESSTLEHYTRTEEGGLSCLDGEVINDQPVTFSKANIHAPRRVRIIPGQIN